MKETYLLISIIGILIMFATILTNYDYDKKLEPNEKLKITGTVTLQKSGRYFNKITINNNLSILCKNPCPSIIDKKIEATIYFDKYYNEWILLELKNKDFNT